jgi:peptidoglycan/xylan/chitin deacetylase (PgdA/CDA1 family)
VVPLAMGLIVLPTPETADLPAPIEVQVVDSVRLVPPDTTLREVREEFGLRPIHGHLLDVEGVPLVRRRFRGFLAVNGQPGRGTQVLQHGDVVAVVDGEDRTEGTVREVIVVPPGTVGNPQTHLGTTPGEQIIVTGRRSGKVVSSLFRPTGPTEQPPAVALTFDDGPHPRHTLEVLRVLRRLNARATFYVLGGLAARYPEVVERLRAAGMEVANHSMTHPYRSPFGRLPDADVVAEVRGATRVLNDLGIQPATFRPPGGSWSDRTVRLAEDMGQRTVLWSVDSRDWTGATAAQIARAVLQDVRPGAIILLHDGGGDRSATVEALPRIIRGLRQMDLRLVLVR